MKLTRGTLMAAALFCCMLPAHADQVLYQYSTWLIKDGKAGSVAAFQSALNETFKNCGSTTRLTPDGVFGNGTKTAIIEASDCQSVSDALDPASAAHNGAITHDLWKIVLPDTPVPSVAQRAAALKLTFEATDYDRMQWNYCQNRPLYSPQDGRTVCKSNDRASFITWGPNGATAGHGREVQAVLNLFLESDGGEAALASAFGDETTSVKRMLTLKHDANGPLETYLCGVWLDKARRATWREGFRTLGRNPAVQSAYKTIYGSRSFDGGKINRFYKVWTSDAFDLPVTELDHGWFVDRATHMSISESKLRTALQTLKQSSGESWPPSAAAIRQYVSLNVRPPNQREDRLGRDIAFYADAIGEANLSAEEGSAWRNRGKRDAVNIGLSDQRTMPDYSPAPSIPHPMPTGVLSAEEASICPEAVLNPERPS